MEHPVYTGVSIGKHRTHRIRVRTRLREGTASNYVQINAQTPTRRRMRRALSAHTNGGCTQNSRALEDALFFFLVIRQI